MICFAIRPRPQLNHFNRLGKMTRLATAVRSYTVWPNRAKRPFSQHFGSFREKVRDGLTESVPKDQPKIALRNYKVARIIYIREDS